MEEITISDLSARSHFVTYLYNAVMGEIVRTGGRGELFFSEDRTAIRLTVGGETVAAKLRAKLAEVVGIGYKYSYLEERLRASLSKRDRRLLLAALIAADYEGDLEYIRARIALSPEIFLDGFFNFRLGPLKEKWSRILEYIPAAFSASDLVKFCEFLVGESSHKIYVKGNAVFGENFTPLRRSRLTGKEDLETEIMLADAGFVYCLGEVEESLGKFLQKYYADRAIFS